MAEQMVLLDPDPGWRRLDEHTREVGRRGVAEARRILNELVQAQGSVGSKEDAAAA